MVTLPIKLILVTLLEALNPKHCEEVRPIYNRTWYNIRLAIIPDVEVRPWLWDYML